ncbi:MAG: Na+/H+ antiporter NhaC family protein, partial [Paraglaciecola sp.]
RLTSATMIAGIMGNVIGGAAYVAIITASTLTKENYRHLNIDKRVLSRNTEAGATIPTPMVPWSDGGIFMASTLGVATVSYLPFLWYHLLVIAITLIYGKLGWFNFNKDEGQSATNAIRT